MKLNVSMNISINFWNLTKIPMKIEKSNSIKIWNYNKEFYKETRELKLKLMKKYNNDNKEIK